MSDRPPVPAVLFVPCQHGKVHFHYQDSARCDAARRIEPLMWMEASKAFKTGLKLVGMSDQVMVETIRAFLGLGWGYGGSNECPDA